MLSRKFRINLRILIFLNLLLLIESRAWAFPYTWVQYIDQAVSIRTITSELLCPTIVIDNKKFLMTERFLLKHDKKIIRVCESIQPSYASGSVNKHKLPILPHTLRKIIMFGDSGIKSTQTVTQWPLNKIINLITKEKPDIIIHLGDFIYSHTNSTNNLNWISWENEWFKPAQSALLHAPWIFIRGNQERCHREWFGWQIFLAPHSYTPECILSFQPFIINIGKIQFIIHDSSFADPDLQSINLDKNVFSQLQFNASETWLLTHRPPFGILKQAAQHKNIINKINFISDIFFISNKLDYIFSGHIHSFEIVNVEKNKPLLSQIVIGTGGVQLEKEIPEQTSPIPYETVHLHLIKYINEFGYLVLEQINNKWNATFKNQNGQAIVSCQLTNKNTICFDSK